MTTIIAHLSPKVEEITFPHPWAHTWVNDSSFLYFILTDRLYVHDQQ